MFRILSGFLILILACSASAQRSKLKPMQFQADKNNLQVLPQRFEYTLLDEDRLKIGDILLDTTQVSFQVLPSPNHKDTYSVHFTWPAGLIKEGELSIKNNSGKAILTAPVQKENIKITEGVTKVGEENLRSEIATLVVDDVDADLVESMKYFPFMVTCVYRESEETRLYLCSKELFFSSQQGLMTIKARSATKKTAQIEVNGKVVGNQGLIYLNDRSENVAFKAQTQTGAFLEIETRKQDVDFKDVVTSDDGSKITLTASGAEPVDSSKIKKISESDWQITLPKSRPVLYLKGDGDIPMRQEFYIRGTLPKEKNRPFLSARSPSRTYSSEVLVNGISPEGVQVKIPSADRIAKLEPSKKNQFLWTLRDLPIGTSTRHYLTVTAEGQDFTVGYDVFRGSAYGLGLGAQYLTPSGIAFATVDFQWWIENLFALDTPWSKFHWGLAFERQQHLTEKSDVAKVDLTTFEFLWRAQEGFQMTDESWGLSLPLQMIQGEGANATAYGFGAFWLMKPQRTFLTPFMEWAELKFQYYVGSTGSDFKVSSAYVLRAHAYRMLSPQWYLRYGLNLSTYNFDPSAAKEETQLGLGISVFWKF